MDLPTLKYTPASVEAEEDGLPCTLAVNTNAELAAISAEHGPAVFVLDKDNVKHLLAFTAKVLDRKRKPPPKGLGEWLLGKGSSPLGGALIPVCTTDTPDRGRLLQGIRSVFEWASRKKKRYEGVCFVGVEPQLLPGLGSGAHSFHAAAAVRAGASGKAAGQRSPPPRGFYESLCSVPVPDSLKSAATEAETKFLGKGLASDLVRRMIIVAAQSDLPVLILGDTGTGKEVVARAIHRLSVTYSRSLSGTTFGPAKSDVFNAIDCGAIAGELLESELFGHIKGAFTGAEYDRIGAWVAAGTGTLFLDEIGNLDRRHQAKILRALQENEVRRVGSNRSEEVAARIVAASNMNIEAMVREGTFRDDLYYRLACLVIRTPAIDETPGQVGDVADTLWGEEAEGYAKPLSEEVKVFLEQQPWPGNIRVLKNMFRVFRAMYARQQPTVERLAFVLTSMGHACARAIGNRIDQGLASQRMECLRHIDRAVMAIRACKGAVERIAGGATAQTPRDQASCEGALAGYLCEVEVLCQRPHLFLDASGPMLRFRDAIASLGDVSRQGAALDRKVWTADVEPLYRDALDALAGAYRALLDRI